MYNLIVQDCTKLFFIFLCQLHVLVAVIIRLYFTLKTSFTKSF